MLQKWDISEKREEILFTKPYIQNNIAHLYFHKLNTKTLQIMRVDFILPIKKAKDIDTIIKEGSKMIPAFKLKPNKSKRGEFRAKIKPSQKYTIKTFIRETYTNPQNQAKDTRAYAYYYLYNGSRLSLYKRISY